MGADLLLAWTVIEVDRDTALSRVDDITAKKLKEKNWYFVEELIEYNWEAMMDLHDGEDDFTDLEVLTQFLPKFKTDLKDWLNYYYDVYEKKKGYPRNLSLIHIKGSPVMITGDMSWGDTWDSLDQLGTLGTLRITEDTYEL